MSPLGTGGLNNNPFSSHHHTGLDFPKVDAWDINILSGPVAFNGNGIPFLSGIYGYNLFVDNNDDSLLLLPNAATSSAGAAEFDIGAPYGNKTFFNNLKFYTSDGFDIIVQDSLTDINHFSMGATITNDSVSDSVSTVTEQLGTQYKSYTATGFFSLRLPNATRDPSPLPGWIAFDSGHLYVCKTSGTWTLIT